MITDATCSLNREPASWVIVNRETGAAVLETYSPAVVAALNTEQYSAVPILEWLQQVNRAAH